MPDETNKGLQQWNYGDIISADRMNKIHDNIYEIWISLEDVINEAGELTLEALQIKYDNGIYFNVADFLDYVDNAIKELGFTDESHEDIMTSLQNSINNLKDKKISLDDIEYTNETYLSLEDFLIHLEAELQNTLDEMNIIEGDMKNIKEDYNAVTTDIVSNKNAIKLINSSMELMKTDILALQAKKIQASEVSYVNGTYITVKEFLDYVGTELKSLKTKDTEFNSTMTAIKNAVETLQKKQYNATDIKYNHVTYTTVSAFLDYLGETISTHDTDIEANKKAIKVLQEAIESIELSAESIEYIKGDCTNVADYLDYVDNTIDDLYDITDTLENDKVDKEEGKSLISDEEIERLANVDNYDDTEVRESIDTKVDKEEGKSLISDSEIERLANVDNYDDTEVRELIDTKSDTTHKHDELYATKESEHIHDNQEILDSITQQLIDLWSKKLVIKYDEETMDLYIGFEDPNAIAYVEYIENISESYIDTGLYANYNWKYEIVVEDNAFSQYENYFGTNEANMRLLRNNYEDSLLFCYGIVNTYSCAITGKKVTICVDKNKLYIDNELIATRPENTSTTSFDRTLLLFQARYQNALDKYGVFKCYSFKAWNEDDVLVLDLRPCLDNLSVPCMYDKVSKKYFYNAGNGMFAHGKRLNADYTAHIYSADNVRDNQLLNKTDSSILPITMYNNLSVVNLNGYDVIRATQSDSYAHSEPIEIPNKFSMDFVVYIEDKTQTEYLWTTQNKDFEGDNQYGYWYLWMYNGKLSLRYRGVGGKSASYLVYDFNLDYDNKKIFNVTFTVDMELKNVRVIVDGVDLSTPTQSNLDNLDANQNPSGTSDGSGERIARMTIGNNFENTRPALVNGLIAMRYYTRALTVDDIVKIQEENKTKYEY